MVGVLHNISQHLFVTWVSTAAQEHLLSVTSKKCDIISNGCQKFSNMVYKCCHRGKNKCTRSTANLQRRGHSHIIVLLSKKNKKPLSSHYFTPIWQQQLQVTAQVKRQYIVYITEPSISKPSGHGSVCLMFWVFVSDIDVFWLCKKNCCGEWQIPDAISNKDLLS